MSYELIVGHSGFLDTYDEAVAEARDGDIFVEVGVALGHSVAYLARKVRESGKRIEVWAVDPWEGGARNGEQQIALGGKGESGSKGVGVGDFGLFCRAMLMAPEDLEIVRVVRATSKRASRMFDDGSVAMVLIDGDHALDAVLDDILAWQRKVRVGGMLAGDDYSDEYPGVVEAVNRMFDTPGEIDVKGTTWRVRI